MSVAIVTGSSGLIGSEAARLLHAKGLHVVGIDNDLRAHFFGAEGSTARNTARLRAELKGFEHHSVDIRDTPTVSSIFRRYGGGVSVVVHCAAQPSHDWAARDPMTDFTVNAQGTLVLLDETRRWAPDAVFIFTSTNKVYGDTVNTLPLVELETRWEVEATHPYARYGVDETMSLDRSMHSVFGASKVAADVMVQEYGRYFGLKTGTFRGGCLTGPAHSATELHGFLGYLVKCASLERRYTVFGHQGKQVRDNIHASDLVNAFWCFIQNPRPGAVYNLGGSRHSSCSVLEAIGLVETLSGWSVPFTLSEQHRPGDHVWWITDVRRFQADYPSWKYRYDLVAMLREMIEAARTHRPGCLRSAP